MTEEWITCTAVVGRGAPCRNHATHRIVGTVGNVDRMACPEHLLDCILISLRQHPDRRKLVSVSEFSDAPQRVPTAIQDVTECY